jgi:nitroreductase
MPLLDLLQRRRSIKRFTDRPVTRAEIETLLDAAVLVPNHRLTEPWRFYVLGPDAREAYGLALGVRKARKIEDPEASRTMRDRVAAEHRALPCMIAIALVKSDNPEIAEEDYASAMMAVQNIMLAAVELGLGTAIRTGGVMGDDAARAAAGVGENERIVAVVNVGEPMEAPVGPAKKRAASELTRWME